MTSERQSTPAPAPLLRPQTARVRRRLRLVFEPFWVVPATWSVLSVVLGLAVPQLDDATRRHLPLLFDGGVESARSVLSTIAGAMISVTGLVFSITIVVLQLASSQFSPRVLATFLQDRLTQHTLGVFAASFLFALTVLRSIDDNGSSEVAVPQLAVTLSFVFVLGAVAMFLAFIHHITQSISVATVIKRVGDETRQLLKSSETRRGRLPDTTPDLPQLEGQTVLTAPRSGYLDRLDPDLLCRTAGQHGVRLEVLHPLGTFVAEGAPVVLVHGASAAPWVEGVWSGLTIQRERTMEQDVTFGIRRLVDIAERALSPGVNDPTTAVQAVDELHDLLRRIVAQTTVVGIYADQDGVPRLLTSEHTFGDLLDLAVDEIALYGRDGLQIPARLDRMLTDLEVAATPAHRDAVRAKRDALVS